MDDHSPIRALVIRATKQRTQQEIADACKPVTRSSLSRWLNGDPFPNVQITVPLLRVCNATEEEIEKAIRGVKSWEGIPIPPPPTRSGLSDEDFLGICNEYRRCFLALRGTGMDKIQYKNRFGEDGLEFLEKIRKSAYFLEGETTYLIGQIPFDTPAQRAEALVGMVEEHRVRTLAGHEERGTITICKAPVKRSTFEEIRQKLIPLWSTATDHVAADQASQTPEDDIIVFSLGCFVDIYEPTRKTTSPTTKDAIK